MPSAPLDHEQRDRWHGPGWCVVEGAIPAGDLVAAQQDLPALFPTAAEFAEDRDPARNRPFRNHVTDGATVLPHFPFESASLNRLVVHDRLVAMAEQLLGTADLRLYQGMASVKYSGATPDYEQLLHVDYANHTLVVPRADAGYQHVEMFVYLSDVTPDTAPTMFVPRSSTRDIPVNRTYLGLAEYAHLYAAEEPACGPAGSVLVYRPDVYHRGTGLRAPASARFLLHVAFKPAGREWLGYQAWPGAAEGPGWYRFVASATVRQLTLVGFPEPGDPYWNEATLDGVAARYPQLDLAPWRRAARR